MRDPFLSGQTNRLLGYPPDARLLILNADDFGMCHAINAGISRALAAGVVQSTSLMAPCPWAPHAIRWLQAHPAVPFGVHLTAICDSEDYRWGPVTCREHVPSLVDETGAFYTMAHMPAFLAQANRDEVEVEFRAQIERVLAAGLKPTHLDWHCLRGAGWAAIFAVILELAQAYGLALRVVGEDLIRQVQSQGWPTIDHGLLDSFALDPDGKAARYAQLLHDLPPGLSEWAVHPALEDGELLALEPDGHHVRQTDLDFWTSDAARQIIRQEGIILLSYAPLQAVWRGAGTARRHVG